jgi:serine/threonine protein kinase/CheY-like chemotaxis protein
LAAENLGECSVSVGITRESFLDRLKESGILSDSELDRAINSASTLDSNDPSRSSLGQSLVDGGVLTGFQIDAIGRGAYAELRIGNYDVLDRLGAGGMGAVFKARHRRMKRIVALKVLSRTMAQDTTFLQRFQREVETIAQLTHPNIVMAFDADEAEAGPFLVMEFVNGADLASLVQKQGPFSVSAAVDCILQAARGLEYAHRQNIIHRDIKPANLMRDVSGVVKVTDLGLARFSALVGGGASGGITQAGGIVGTVDYMPPEQSLDPGGIDHRADIYSLGGTLHYLLFGQPPYQGQTLMATLLKHREAPIPSLCESRKDVPIELDAIFRRMEAKTPADRYQTMTEVVGALETVLAILARSEGSEVRGLGLEVRSQESGVRSQESGEPPTEDYRPALEPATGVWQESASMSPETTMVTTSQADTAQTIVPGQPTPPPLAVSVCKKVILVEPSRAQSGIIRKYLQGQGVQNVVAVGSGQEALKTLDNDRPDAVVSALHLPDMNGVELGQRIHSQSKGHGPGFVLISSEAESSEAGTLSKCGKAVLLHKPFTPEKLAEALKVVITPVGAAPAAGKSKLGQLRVLIVDDSAPARLHIRGVLEGLGLSKFVEAADGARAVAAAAKDTFDLIVTDYNMPYLDGRGLITFLKENPATTSVPIIMVTTETDPGKLQAVRQLGVTICDKSFQRDVVQKIIHQMIGG